MKLLSRHGCFSIVRVRRKTSWARDIHSSRHVTSSRSHGLLAFLARSGAVEVPDVTQLPLVDLLGETQVAIKRIGGVSVAFSMRDDSLDSKRLGVGLGVFERVFSATFSTRDLARTPEKRFRSVAKRAWPVVLRHQVNN